MLDFINWQIFGIPEMSIWTLPWRLGVYSLFYLNWLLSKAFAEFPFENIIIGIHHQIDSVPLGSPQFKRVAQIVAEYFESVCA